MHSNGYPLCHGTGRLGNEVSGRSETTLRGIDDFVTGFLGYENKATNVLAAADADPELPLANIYAGFTWMFLEAAGAEERATAYLKRAQALRLKANTREQLMLDQLERWITGDIPAVQRIGETIVDNFPRDLASVKLHQYFSFNRGDARAMLAIAQKAEAANLDNPHLHGMLAFGYEQMHDLGEAEREARLALEIKNKEPWAQHALAHVMLSTGRVKEGVRVPRRGAADLDRSQQLHVHPQLVAYGAVPISASATTGRVRRLRPSRLGHRTDLLAGPGRRRLAARPHGDCRP